jgi:hypothetical protein
VLHSDRWATRSGIRPAPKACYCRRCRPVLPSVWRDLIRERTGEGRKRAMAEGVKFGRKRKLSEYQRVKGHPAPRCRRDLGHQFSGYLKNEAATGRKSCCVRPDSQKLGRRHLDDVAPLKPIWRGLVQMPNSISRATGPKWIAAAIAIAANQASVISQPGNQPTMTSPKTLRGGATLRASKRTSQYYYGTI